MYSFSVSATTRGPRPGEAHGKDYYFMSHEEFDKLIAENAFVEWANVHTNKYGTLKSELERIAKEGKVPLLDIDIQGASQLSKNKVNANFCFVLPCKDVSKVLEVTRKRLEHRGTETEEQIQKRLTTAEKEINMFKKSKFFQHRIINEDLDKATADF